MVTQITIEYEEAPPPEIIATVTEFLDNIWPQNITTWDALPPPVTDFQWEPVVMEEEQHDEGEPTLSLPGNFTTKNK